MQVILPILEFIQSILTKPAWIMGLFAFVGLVALKRPAHKVMTGTLKPILGYIMLSAGAAVVQENLAPLGTFIETGFHITGVVPNNEVVVSMAQSVLGVQTMMILILGYVVNIIIARFTKFKYIFLTGHHSMFMACLLSAVLQASGFEDVQLIIVGGMFTGPRERHASRRRPAFHREGYRWRRDRHGSLRLACLLYLRCSRYAVC